MKTRTVFNRRIIYSLVLFLFFMLCIFMICVHENWRDEAQAWMMAKELSPYQLFLQMKFEGHPCLWHLILMPFAKAGFPYVTMNIISTILVSAAVALLLFKSPLSLWVKLLGICGSAFWYYYAVISRSYSLIPVLLFLSATFYENRHSHPFKYCFCLALLVQTHVIMLPFAGIISLFFMFEAIGIYSHEHNSSELIKKATALLLPLLSFFLFLAQIWGVQQSSAFHPSELSTIDLLSSLFQSLLYYWAGYNYNISSLYGLICGFMACFFLALIVFCLYTALKSKNGSLVKPFFAVTLTITFQIFFSVLFYGTSAQRSFTWLFMWIWFLWVVWSRIDHKRIKITVLSIFVLLSIPSYVTIERALLDITKPYSTSADCANYINRYLPEDTVYIETRTSDFTSLRPYLPDSFEAYSIVTGENEKFSTWQEKEPLINSIDQLEKFVADEVPDSKDYWIIISYDSTGPIPEWFYANGTELVYNSFNKSIVHEDYAILHVDLPLSINK